MKKGPAKPTQPGLRLATKTTEAKAPTLTPKWGASKSPSKPPAVDPKIWPRPASKPPADLGLSSERTRQKMVDRLMRQGISHAAVLAAMQQVPRHRFVDEALASRAYEDSALPIGHGQTISQPFVVARSIELALQHVAHTGRPQRALEVGAGCGYQAAVMARCFDQVLSVERLKALYDLARSNLQPLKLSNLKLVHGDGLVAGQDDAPFDAILLSAGMTSIPQELLTQLALGGVLVAPIGEPEQRLTVIVREEESVFKTYRFDVVRYVPILRGIG